MILNTWSGSKGLINQPSQNKTQKPFAAPADEAKRLIAREPVSVIASRWKHGEWCNSQQPMVATGSSYG